MNLAGLFTIILKQQFFLGLVTLANRTQQAIQPALPSTWWVLNGISEAFIQHRALLSHEATWAGRKKPQHSLAPAHYLPTSQIHQKDMEWGREVC